MFKEILTILRREDLLTQAMKDVEEMLAKSELMFKAAVDKIIECKTPEIDIYEEDKEIDRSEWDVRRKVMEHLILSDRKGDVTAALVITDSVRDIERIGDYSKSIFELQKIFSPKVIVNDTHAKLFREITDQTFEIFKLTRDAYKEGNIQKAEIVLSLRLQTSKKCDEVLEYLASEQNLTAEYAVVYTLLSGYLKRVIAHLKNIASIVINPFRRMEIRAEEGVANVSEKKNQ
jgi:phosphate uptake regulator